MSAARTPSPTVVLAFAAPVALALGLGCTRPPPAAPVPPLPRAVVAHYLDGKLAGYEGDWDAAVEALSQAAADAPDQPMVVVELARVQMKAKRTADAVATLARARHNWPDHPQVWL